MNDLKAARQFGSASPRKMATIPSR